MEISTKERLTGALIVVLALVVIAPELLSGRSTPDSGTPPAQNPEDGAPLQTFNVELGAARSDQTAVPSEPAAATAELPAVRPPVTEEVAQPVAKEIAPPAEPAPQRAAPAKESATSPAGKWWVQLGSFQSESNARRLAQQIRDGGYTITVSRSGEGARIRYRVLAGPVADRPAAVALQARLVSAGQKDAALVPP